jgi:hypothetical protein
MAKKLTLTFKEYADFYSTLCDVICQEDLGLNDPVYRHTSDEARRKALQITDRLEAEGYLAECPAPPKRLRR